MNPKTCIEFNNNVILYISIVVIFIIAFVIGRVSKNWQSSTSIKKK